MTKTEYILLLNRIIVKLHKLNNAGNKDFDDPKNGKELVELFQNTTNDIKEVVDLYNKEKESDV